MPVLNFNGSSDEVITALGSLDLTGAFTIAVLARLDATGRAHTFINTRSSAAGDLIGLGVQANNAFVADVSGDGLAAVTTGTAIAGRWYLFATSKAAGTVTPRLHLYDFTALSWSHANGGLTMGNAATAAGGSVAFGRQRTNTWADASRNFLDGDLVAAAAWSASLSDGQVEALQTSSSLSGWTSLSSPVAVWLFRGATVGDAVQDTVGAADESSRSGTTVLAENPPIPYDPTVSTVGSGVLVREKPPLRHMIDVQAPGGRHYRLGEDEPDPANVFSGLRYSDTMPGGFETADCTLPREPGVEYPDLERLSDWHVLGVGGEPYWGGRLERAPRTSGDEVSVSPSAVGYQAHLDDDKSAREVYVDLDMSKWQGVTAARKVSVGSTYAHAEPSVAPGADGEPTLITAVTSPWSVAPGVPRATATLLRRRDTARSGVFRVGARHERG